MIARAVAVALVLVAGAAIVAGTRTREDAGDGGEGSGPEGQSRGPFSRVTRGGPSSRAPGGSLPGATES